MDLAFVEKFIAIMLSLLILFLAWINARIAKSWLVSSSVFCIFWFLYTFFPLIFVMSAPVHYESVLYIFVFCVAFSSSIFCFNWVKANDLHYIGKVLSGDLLNFDRNVFILLFVSCQLFVFASLMIDVINQGFSLSDILFNLMSTSASYISLRYSGALQESLIVRIGTVFTYTGVMFGGAVFTLLSKFSSKLLVFIFSLLPSIFVMVVQGAKGTIFLSLFLFYASYLAFSMYENKKSFFSFKSLKYLMLLVLLLLPAIVSSFLSRGLYDQDMEYIFSKLAFYFYSYAFAHLYAFSDWFGFYSGYNSVMDYAYHSSREFGFYTFTSFFRMLGDDRYVPPGVFEEYFYYKQQLKSNIYTFFRGVILDYGVLGSLIFAFTFGFLVNLLYFLMLVVRGPYLFLSLYITMYGFYYTSFIISVFMWNSLLVSSIVFYLLVVFSRLVTLKK